MSLRRRPIPGGETCWTLIRGAADGGSTHRSAFAEFYLPVVRAYLGARWRGSPAADLDDAVQDTFLECLKPGGALSRADAANRGRFRSYLFAVVRNVARRHEERRKTTRRRFPNGAPDIDAFEGRCERASKRFDREWATNLLKRAAKRQEEEARELGPRALRRVEILKLRFGEDRPIREIARIFNEEPARLHHEYARAREEFKRSLRAEIAFHDPGSARDIEQECRELLSIIEKAG